VRDDARQVIARRLALEVEASWYEYSRATKEFNDIIHEVPSGLPHPDGAVRIAQAGRESRRTLDLYSTALHRYSEFVLHGVTPKDLEEPE